MLQFNPYFRPTAKEMLKHPIFDEIRTDIEPEADFKVVINIDKNSE